ncbi:mannose-6-phosphate isomerase, class I [Bacteroidota bacterium]|nr:mannose-6-phosphate isomerase, class I [Bacteroidota bacterium]
MPNLSAKNINMIKQIKGFVQHYAWGGYHFLPALLSLDNKERKPFAELWFGDHSGGTSPLIKSDDSKTENLRQFIDLDPSSLLGEKTYIKDGGRLPFLLKILDVHKMLSIQAHPSKEAAIKGFLDENKRQIPLNAHNRVFKDQNSKPEMMVALSPFWLLHGFLPAGKAAEQLDKIPSLKEFSNVFKTEGIKKGYQKWMELPQTEIDNILAPLRKSLLDAPDASLNKNSPDFWAKKAFHDFIREDGHLDRGIFSIYVMNIVHLQPGEAIFQDSGLLHAYLEGTNIELMVNSDNVFRGGLTDKYMDIPLLLDHLDFRPTLPNKLKPVIIDQKEKRFIIPSSDFELKEYALEKGVDLCIPPSSGPSILLCLHGSICLKAENSLIVPSGEALFVPHNTQIDLQQKGEETAVLFKAGIPPF